jgi:hypothetical protein
MIRGLVGMALALVTMADIASNTRIQAQDDATGPGPRKGHCLVYDNQRHRVILTGGYELPNHPQTEELWDWNGSRWEKRAAVGAGAAPPPRTLSGVAYDMRRNRVVLFGGFGVGNSSNYTEQLGDTWEWDGKSWHLMPDTSVGTRNHHVMVYDAARGKTVMYGGQTSNGSWVTDTWEWDGKRWTKITTPGPGARGHFAMAYDSKRKRVVLFGGFGEDIKYRNDTWEWDGHSWQKVSDEGPPPRARHRMAYDGRAGLVVLYGGDGVKTEPGGGFRYLDDTWTWDGKRWAEAKVPGPGSRFMHAMAYDEARGKTVLYSGGSADRAPSDTWEWDGKEWRRPPRGGLSGPGPQDDHRDSSGSISIRWTKDNKASPIPQSRAD